MKKLISYGIRIFVIFLIVFTSLVIIELNNIKEVSALPPQAKVPIDTPKHDKGWELDQDKLKDYIAKNENFKDKTKMEIIGNASNRDWAVDERFSYLEFIYDGKGIVMVYNSSINDELI